MNKNTKIYSAIILSGVASGLIFLYFHTKFKILRVAKALIGQSEIGNNESFDSENFEKLLSKYGWNTGEAWCMYFAKAVYMETAPKRNLIDIGKTLAGNTNDSWNRIVKDDNDIWKVSEFAKIGDLVFWQMYSNGVPKAVMGNYVGGHVGIVSKVGFNDFKSIEGNTGGVTGIMVDENEHTFDYSKESGYRLLGFARLK